MSLTELAVSFPDPLAVSLTIPAVSAQGCSTRTDVSLTLCAVSTQGLTRTDVSLTLCAVSNTTTHTTVSLTRCAVNPIECVTDLSMHDSPSMRAAPRAPWASVAFDPSVYPPVDPIVLPATEDWEIDCADVPAPSTAAFNPKVWPPVDPIVLPATENWEDDCADAPAAFSPKVWPPVDPIILPVTEDWDADDTVNASSSSSGYTTLAPFSSGEPDYSRYDEKNESDVSSIILPLLLNDEWRPSSELSSTTSSGSVCSSLDSAGALRCSPGCAIDCPREIRVDYSTSLTTDACGNYITKRTPVRAVLLQPILKSDPRLLGKTHFVPYYEAPFESWRTLEELREEGPVLSKVYTNDNNRRHRRRRRQLRQ